MTPAPYRGTHIAVKSNPMSFAVRKNITTSESKFQVLGTIPSPVAMVEPKDRVPLEELAVSSKGIYI